MDSFTLFLRFFSRALMLLMVMPVVNSVKGLVAYRLGDDSAEREGRITLNPMAHLDPIGSLAILLCGFGWSKPLPINPSRMREYKKGVIIISLTGPITHFLSAIVCNFAYELMCCIPAVQKQILGGGITPSWCVLFILYMLAQINICLGVIHLLPLPPLDGFTILHFCAGNKFNSWYYSNRTTIHQVSPLILLALFFLPDLTGGHLDPLGWIISWVSWLLSFATNWVPAVFGG